MDVTTKSIVPTHQRRAGLLKHQLQLVKRRDCDRYEILRIEESLSFEKGLFIFIRACQLLAQKMDGVILVGLAGPSGAGKTVFTEKLTGFMPGIAVICMDNYNDSSRVIDGNFDDPRLTDYDLLLKNINDLKMGKEIEVPIYDFKLSKRVGYRPLKVPSSKIVVIEGIYALSEKLRPLLDLRVAVRGGIHLDLIKRVLRDINRAGQEPEEIIHQISETVYPMYKAFIEPDLETAHIKIINKFNPFSGFQNATYILKSARIVTEDQIREVLAPNVTEANEETYDIYLLPPGEDPETCQSYLRMRNREGKYSLMFEEIVIDNPFIISPRITFEVSVRLLGGLMALGYTITTILKRTSLVFRNNSVIVKVDKLEQLQRKYVQVQGKNRSVVAEVAKNLGLDGSYIPHSYIEQIQLEKLISGLRGPSEDLKSKLSIHESLISSPRSLNTSPISKKAVSTSTYSRSWTRDETKEFLSSLPNSQGIPCQEQQKFVKPKIWVEANGKHEEEERQVYTPAASSHDQGYSQMLEKLSNLNERLEEVLAKLGGFESKLATVPKIPRSLSQQNVSGAPAHTSGYANGPTLPLIPSSSIESLVIEVKVLGKGQQNLMTQLEMLVGLVRGMYRDPKQKQRSECRGAWDLNLSTHRKVTVGLLVLSLGFALGVVGTKACQRSG